MAAQRALLPLYRLRFNLLYQFGFLDVNSDEWVPYEKETSGGHPDIAKTHLLAKMPAFSTADEVVLLDIEIPLHDKLDLSGGSATSMGAHFAHLSPAVQAALTTLTVELSQQPSALGSKTRLNVSNVRRLYPLTTQAGQLLASRLDPRIRQQPAVFETVVEEADARLLTSETRLGSEALLEIAGFLNEQLDDALLTDVSNAVAIRLGRREIQSDDSFWVHLITYDRYEPFPKNDYGYLYDLCVVFYRSLSVRDGKREHDAGYEATTFYKALEANRDIAAGGKITQLLLSVEWADKLRQSLTDPTTSFRKYLSAFLYLKLRQEFAAEEYQFSRKLLEVIRRTADVYRAETRVALQLLGGFLTFDKISGAYYEVMQIPLFQINGRKLSKVITNQPSALPVIQTITDKAPNITSAPIPEMFTPEIPAETFDFQISSKARRVSESNTNNLPWLTDVQPAKAIESVEEASERPNATEIDQSVDPSSGKSTGRGSRKGATATPKAPKKLTAPKVPKTPAAGASKARKEQLANIQQLSLESGSASPEVPDSN
jgi:hypothetical protein